MQQKIVFDIISLYIILGIFYMPKYAAARFCEGGHICTLPRECCTQGCCPPYQNGPRQLPPPSEHVLNLFFISHWFFWCVVVAVILAILCAYSLWKKRRTLCGWGFPEHHVQSEGDSAGSCYAPPQYSRCSSFHHPPPPYTEVTSKPDLYPLVFTCNSENGKHGSSYLMVQYFRNYIVRPAGSLSAASTVDSLSSSFICNVNEANTLVPPTYSRAASPDVGFSSHFQQHYMMPRSASQLVCANGIQQELAGNISGQQVYQNQTRNSLYTAVGLSGAVGGISSSEHTTAITAYSNHQRTSAESTEDSGSSTQTNSHSGSENNSIQCQPRGSGFVQSQSDQQFRYIANSNTSISDIFVNNSCAASGGMTVGDTNLAGHHSIASITSVPHPQPGGTPVIYSNGCIKPNPQIHRTNTNPTQFVETHRDPVYNSCTSIGGISITVPVCADGNNTEFKDLHMLRRSLETCCQLLQHQQQQQQQQISSTNYASGDSPLRMNDLTKKYVEEGLRSYMTSGTCSGVSSLANIGTPSSPPQATSPTGEVKEILDQIRQLQDGVSYEDLFSSMRPTLRHTMSSPSPTHSKRHSAEPNLQLQRFATMPEERVHSAQSPTNSTIALESVLTAGVKGGVSTSPSTIAQPNVGTNKNASCIVTKRPSTLQQSKKKFYTSKPNKAMYIPMMPSPGTTANRCILKSPGSSIVGANFFTNRNRIRKGWISRSAPTTPAGLPPNCLGDDSPLLNDHDEDPEGEQIAEMD